jgi:hypothetical protein
MKLYVVNYCSWEDYERDFTQLRGVFDSEEKAIEYIGKHQDEIEDEPSFGSCFETWVVELNEELG